MICEFDVFIDQVIVCFIHFNYLIESSCPIIVYFLFSFNTVVNVVNLNFTFSFIFLLQQSFDKYFYFKFYVFITP